MKITSITTDANAAAAGKWFDYDDAQFLIAAWMNPAHKKVLQRLGKKHAKDLRKNNPDTAELVALEAQAEAILLDWKNLQTPDGKDYPATPENRLALLKASAPLRDFVAGTSMEHANFLIGEEAAAVAEIKSPTPVGPQVG